MPLLWWQTWLDPLSWYRRGRKSRGVVPRLPPGAHGCEHIWGLAYRFYGCWLHYPLVTDVPSECPVQSEPSPVPSQLCTATESPTPPAERLGMKPLPQRSKGRYTGNSCMLQAPVLRLQLGPEVAPSGPGMALRLTNWSVPPLTSGMTPARIISPNNIPGPQSPLSFAETSDTSYFGVAETHQAL